MPEKARQIQINARKIKGLTGSVNIIKQHTKYLAEKGFRVSLVADSCEKNFIHFFKRQVSWNKTIKWPKSTLFQRKVYDWQTCQKNKKYPNSLILGHGDSLNQDILFLHNCIHQALENGDPLIRYQKNRTRDFHEMIFKKGRMSLLVCNSRMMKNDLEKRFEIKVPIQILYPGFDPHMVQAEDKKRTAEIRFSLAAQPTDLVLGLISSGDLTNRNAELVIESFASLPEHLRERSRLLLVGKEKYQERFLKKANDLGVAGKVRWREPQKDVENLIGACDLIVHVAKSEAFGMTVLESMALGKPIVSSRTVGCTEIFPQISQEFVVENMESKTISAAIEKLLKNFEVRLKVGKENQAATQGLTWSHHLENFNKMVEEQWELKFKKYGIV